MNKLYLSVIIFLSGCVAYTEDYGVYRAPAPAVVYTQPQAVYVEQPPATPVIYWERQVHYAAPLPRPYTPHHFEPHPQPRPLPVLPHHFMQPAPQPHGDKPHASFNEPRKPAVQPAFKPADGHKKP